MAVVATVAGDCEEARFWRGLPATLASLKAALPPAMRARFGAAQPPPSALENGILASFSTASLPPAASIDNRCAPRDETSHPYGGNLKAASMLGCAFNSLTSSSKRVQTRTPGVDTNGVHLMDVELDCTSQCLPDCFSEAVCTKGAR
jgi:hypothetical protein